MKTRLGQIVKDKITGVTGVVMAKTEDLTNGIQVGILQTKLTKDEKEHDWIWIDERRCLPTTRKDVMVEEK